MRSKLFLNKLFICLTDYEKKYLKNSFSNAFKITILCEAATNSWKLNREWTP